MSTVMTRVQVAALLAVAQDYAFGQPPGSQLRATVLAQDLAAAAGADTDDPLTWCDTTRW